MLFLDINTNYCPRGGGVRTYHHSKIEWFKKHPEHGYVLLCPGPATRAEQLASNVQVQQVYGYQLTKDPRGYRLLIDFAKVTSLIKQLKPQVIEVGDPWITSIYSIVFRRLGIFEGLLTSFYHSDTTKAYLEPWAAKGRLRPLKRLAVPLATAWLLGVQRQFTYTLTSSEGVRDDLVSRGVNVVARMPFGAPAEFLSAYRPKRMNSRKRIRLLYFGRLEVEKGADLLLEVLPGILEQPEFEVSVMGRGLLTRRFQEISHPRFNFLGYVEGRNDVLSVLQGHDLMLAPGPYETFGLAALEAMAMGLPVIGPDQGGTGELLREVPGAMMFRAGDSQHFLNVAARALSEDLEEHSLRHREVALRYGSWNQAISRMVEFYVDRWKSEAGGLSS